jgi:hypothetical protein
MNFLLHFLPFHRNNRDHSVSHPFLQYLKFLFALKFLKKQHALENIQLMNYLIDFIILFYL